MAKTILKLHANGNFETIGTPLQELKNLFVLAETVPGYLSSSTGVLNPPEDGERVTDFIPITNVAYVFQIWWDAIASTQEAYANIIFFNASKQFVATGERISQNGLTYFTNIIYPPSDAAFLRISVNLLETGVARVQLVKGSRVKPYTLAPKDLKAQGIPAISFKDGGITVPEIIEYPPPGTRNYFVEKTSVRGFIENGVLVAPTQHDRTSDFINVTGWGSGVTRVTFDKMDASYHAWVGVFFYNAAKEFVSVRFDDYVTPSPVTGSFIFEYTFPIDVAFIRVGANHYDHSIAETKISVEKGNVATQKHYLAPEDIPAWVVDTGQPVSFFEQGIVIKGGVINTVI